MPLFNEPNTGPYDVPVPEALSRREHPETSKQAIYDKVKSGSFGRDCLWALDTLRAHPGSTGYELDKFAGAENDEVRKRMNDLRKAGLAVIGRSRKCSIRGSMCQTWWPADHPEIPVSVDDVEGKWCRFWAAYPRKTARKAAEMAFFRLSPTDDLFNDMMAALERHKAVWKEAEFIPHASTWINGERWNDEITTSGTYVKTMAEKMRELGK